MRAAIALVLLLVSTPAMANSQCELPLFYSDLEERCLPSAKGEDP